MRSSPTSSEQLLWLALRGGKLGASFRRQVVLGPFVVDFLAPAIRLVVEVDGGYHSRRQALDARRDERLQRWGYRVLRVQVQEVVRELPRVLRCIRDAVASNSAGA